MTNEEGIKLLTDQKNQIAALNDQTFRTWESHTTWIFEQLFGKDSDMYQSISQFNFYNYHSDDSTLVQIRRNAPRAVSIVDSAINLVSYRTIPPTPPKLNLIYRIKDGWLILWATVLIGAYPGIFYIGKWAGRVEEATLSEKSKTNPQAENKAENNSDTSTQKILPDSPRH